MELNGACEGWRPQGRSEGKRGLECPAGMAGMSPELHGRGERVKQAGAQTAQHAESVTRTSQHSNLWTLLLCWRRTGLPTWSSAQVLRLSRGTVLLTGLVNLSGTGLKDVCAPKKPDWTSCGSSSPLTPLCHHCARTTVPPARGASDVSCITQNVCFRVVFFLFQTKHSGRLNCAAASN